MPPAVTVGEMIYLQEQAYRYGLGNVTLRVTQIIDDTSNPDWIELRGIETLWNGARGKERRIWVSVAALRSPRSRRAP